ncbi:hypothetical protein MTP99_000493 [Tenebrio molitor]|jgi:hypothetical protein|nr:hypothetical protein MTP99_000493 [Tenebrio molitor]
MKTGRRAVFSRRLGGLHSIPGKNETLSNDGAKNAKSETNRIKREPPPLAHFALLSCLRLNLTVGWGFRRRRFGSSGADLLRGKVRTKGCTYTLLHFTFDVIDNGATSEGVPRSVRDVTFVSIITGKFQVFREDLTIPVEFRNWNKPY